MVTKLQGQGMQVSVRCLPMNWLEMHFWHTLSKHYLDLRIETYSCSYSYITKSRLCVGILTSLSLQRDYSNVSLWVEWKPHEYHTHPMNHRFIAVVRYSKQRCCRPKPKEYIVHYWLVEGKTMRRMPPGMQCDYIVDVGIGWGLLDCIHVNHTECLQAFRAVLGNGRAK